MATPAQQLSGHLARLGVERWHAAGLRGRSRTDFIREAALRAAEDAILETTLIRMSPAGFESFLETLSAPAKPVPEMVELLQRPAPWEPGTRTRKR